MNFVSDFFADKKRMRISLYLLIVSLIFGTVAFIIEISDNLPGIILLYLGSISLVLAFVHHWRATKKFIILLISMIIAFPVFAILHNFIETVSESPIIQVLSAGFFLIAVILCPAGILVGIIGSIYYFKNNKK